MAEPGIKKSRGETSLQVRLDKLFSRLRQHSDKDKVTSLLVLAVAAQAALTLAVAVLAWGFPGSLSPDINAWYLELSLYVQVAMLVVSLACLLWNIHRNQGEKPDYLAFYVFAGVTAACTFFGINSIGSLRSPILVVMPVGFLGVFILFDYRKAFFAAITGLAAYMAMGMLELSRIIPYAPLYSGSGPFTYVSQPGQYLFRFFLVLVCLSLTLILINALIRYTRKMEEDRERLVRERAKNEVKQTKRQYRSLVQNSPDGICVVQEGMLKFINPRLMEFSGFSLEDLENETFLSFIHEKDQEKVVVRHFKRLAGEEVPNRYVITARNKQGREFLIEINSSIIEWEGKAATLNFLRDVSEREKAQEDLKQSEERFRELADLLPESVFETNSQNRLTFVNKAGFKRFGYTREDFENGLDGMEMLVQEDRARAMENLVKRREGQAVGLAEYTARAKDGATFPILFNAAVILREGRYAGLRGFLIDITRQKQAEEELKLHRERLEELVEERTEELKSTQKKLLRREKLAALGKLAGGVGHELRNPLGAISNAAYFLKMIQPDAEEKVRDYLEIISTEVDRSARIISDLMDFSRLNSGTRQAAQVSDLLARALSRSSLKENIALHRHIPEDLPPVYVDPTHADQILFNIIDNAFQAMPEGGDLTIRAEAGQEEVRLSLSDTGPGISPENMESIFEPLFTTRTKGIGLGLAISRDLAEANGGRISVKSVEGEGATFSIFFRTGEEPE